METIAPSAGGPGTYGGQVLRYAGFWRRLAADLIDNLVLLPVMSFLAPTEWPARPSLGTLTRALGAHPVHQLLGLLAGLAYSIFFWIKFLGTPGKLLMGCRLVDASTLGPLSVRQSLVRNLGYLVSYATLGLGFLWIAWDKRKQGLPDKMAGSLVLYVGPGTRPG